jgi:hypothetical protein
LQRLLALGLQVSIGWLRVLKPKESPEVRLQIHRLLRSIGLLPHGVDGQKKALGSIRCSALIGMFPDKVGLAAHAGIVGGGSLETSLARCVGLLIVTYHFSLIVPWLV